MLIGICNTKGFDVERHLWPLVERFDELGVLPLQNLRHESPNDNDLADFLRVEASGVEVFITDACTVADAELIRASGGVVVDVGHGGALAGELGRRGLLSRWAATDGWAQLVGLQLNLH